jgi:epsilon-lactone hydrolase
MNTARIFKFLLMPTVILMAAVAQPCPAESIPSGANPAPSFAVLEADQNAANAQKGSRTVPGRSIPVPDTVSPEVQALIAAPYRVPAWDANPKSAEQWKSLVATLAARGAAAQAGIREKLGITMQPAIIGGVKAFILAPLGNPSSQPKSATRARPRRRLCVQSRRGGN